MKTLNYKLNMYNTQLTLTKHRTGDITVKLPIIKQSHISNSSYRLAYVNVLLDKNKFGREIEYIIDIFAQGDDYAQECKSRIFEIINGLTSRNYFSKDINRYL